MVEQAHTAGHAPRKGLLWRLIAFAPARAAIVAMCRYMSRRVERRRGPPTAESAHGVVRLWHIEHFREVSLLPDEPWPLSGGVVLRSEDPVLDFHIVGDKLLAQLADGRRWREIIREEFRSLAPQIEQRDESALVGSTILARQVAEFGAVLRPVPAGIHRSWDTFYRKLILLAFHPGGADRAARESPPVFEAAIARADFCRRFG
jgi:YkoP-like protein